jgi:hypothetical protein
MMTTPATINAANGRAYNMTELGTHVCTATSISRTTAHRHKQQRNQSKNKTLFHIAKHLFKRFTWLQS